MILNASMNSHIYWDTWYVIFLYSVVGDYINIVNKCCLKAGHKSKSKSKTIFILLINETKTNKNLFKYVKNI